VLPPIAFDVSFSPWPVRSAAAIICINVIHISPWEATLALIRGSGEILPPGGVLVTYGPYRRGGQHTAPSNEAFDASLKARDPRWGVRDLEAVAAVAKAVGLELEEVIPMPANNFTVVLRKEAVEKLKAKIADPASHFKSKRVRVTGTIDLYRDKPQIAVNDAENIRIIE
jgi:hypothetical protein